MTRRRVLVEPDAAVRVKLMSNPGCEYVIAAGDLDKAHTYSTTAWRIRTGRQAAFRPAGAFQASVSTNANEPDRVAPAELRCMFVPIGSV